jgi:hypothetical protein
MVGSPPLDRISFDAPDGRVTRATGPDGHVLYEAEWSGESLRRLEVVLPTGDRIELVTGRGEHPIIGPCDALRMIGDAEPLAFCGRTDWAAPCEIPALDRPAALPAGGGTALLNALAWQAARAGIPWLRYRGPYPTAALYASLRASFQVEGDPERMEEEFTRDVEDAAIAGRMSHPPVEFVPAPHVWTWPTRRVCVQQRSVIERVYIDGHAYDRAGIGPRRLLGEGDGDLVACIVLAGRRVADILRLSGEGEPLGEPTLLEPAPRDLCGEPLPDAVVAVLAEAIAKDAPRLLRPAVLEVLRPGDVCWGDPGMALARASESGVVLHGALVRHLPEDPHALLAVLVELLGWPVRKLAQRRLSEAAEALLRR